MTRILLVEDQPSVALGLRRSLEAAGYAVTWAADAPEARAALAVSPVDLIVLDLMLPGASGFDFLGEMRSEGNETAVLILSARGQEIDKVHGFRLGADDYVVKPVGVLELAARVDAILRRVGPRPSPEYRFDDVSVDVGARRVLRAGAPVTLSRREFDLLDCLLRHEGSVVSRETLLSEVWGYKRFVATRTIDTHIATLRARLEVDTRNPRRILTVRGVGYRIALGEADSPGPVSDP